MVDHPLDRNAGLKPPAQHEVTGHTNGRRPHDETFDIIGPGHDIESVTEQVMGVVLKDRIRVGWVIFLGFALALLAVLVVSISYVLVMGVGVWGINKTVGWGFDIINFVWWIGIGHAGTLISAILLLVHQNWRTSINRFAEAMTIFAVMCAGLFPLLHLGRHQYFYWLAPLPNTMGMWPQFRSPLEWDFFAVSTYFTVSALFWYIGLIPDLATLRDRAQNRTLKILYGMAALGWRGSNQHWHRYMAVYLILAGISTPLVLSVHSTISFDFAFSIVPGWHTTIFPPYFVAGAVFAGFAMVLMLAIPLRHLYGLKDLITMRHLENCAKVMLATGLMVVYGYFMEVFTAWYSGNIYERYMQFESRMGSGDYAWAYWSLIFCNAVVPQILWIKKYRTNLTCLFLVSVVVSIGMWLERFVIIVVSLSRDYLPSSWAIYQPTFWDWALYAGTFGLFLTLFLLFVRALPSIAVAEMRELVHHESHHGPHGGGHGGHLTHDPHGKTIEDRDHSGGTKEAFSGSA
jgi:molybdopterin-containing oxidoreductase family membrane subunit